MKIIAILVLLSALGLVLMSGTIRSNAPNVPLPAEFAHSFHDLEVTGIDGAPLKMSDFKGKYVLCVNVASRCGFTPQYKPLQELYDKYQDQLVIIGFPCNQFLGQEPGTEEQIATFCEKNYGVNFPMTEKINVKGKNQHPVYAWLTSKDQNGVADAKVGWNFNKFLISPEGQWLKHFPSKVDPLSEEIVQYLQ